MSDLQNPKHEQRKYSYLLGTRKMEVSNLDSWQYEYSDFNNNVCQNRGEEKSRLVNVAGTLNRSIPSCLNGYARQYRHAQSQYEPADGNSEKYLYGYSNACELEDAPVESENGELGKGDAERVCDAGGKEQHSRSS